MEQPIKPNNITKPIQLLAAWLAGLLAIDSCFLIAAAKLPTGTWEAQALTVAAIANVPLFLAAVFLLQTRFRPELQEDLYYSTYISQKTNARVQVSKEDAVTAPLQQRLERLEVRLANAVGSAHEAGDNANLDSLRFGINKNLADREDIARLLSRAGVAGYALFGTDKIPQERVVAIAADLDPKIEKSVLHLASEAGFKKFSYIQDFEEIEEQVLLGAYGKDTLELTPAPQTARASTTISENERENVA